MSSGPTMLDNLTERLSRVVKTLRGEARLTDANIQDALREVRLALLEADVALPVVKEFIAAVREKALGAEVVGSLTPGQALIGVVHRELAALMGGAAAPLVVRDAAAGRDPARRLAGRGQDHHRRQARAPSADRRRRRCCSFRPTSTGPRRSSNCGCSRTGRRRFLSVDGGPAAGRHRQGGARLGAQALSRRADRRHRRPAGHRRGDDEGDRRSCTPRCIRSRRCSSSTRCRARTPSTRHARSAMRCR